MGRESPRRDIAEEADVGDATAV